MKRMQFSKHLLIGMSQLRSRIKGGFVLPSAICRHTLAPAAAAAAAVGVGACIRVIGTSDRKEWMDHGRFPLDRNSDWELDVAEKWWRMEWKQMSVRIRNMQKWQRQLEASRHWNKGKIYRYKIEREPTNVEREREK